MKRVLSLAVAVAATTLYAGAPSASAHPTLATASQDKPSDAGKADPPSQAKGGGPSAKGGHGKKSSSTPGHRGKGKAKGAGRGNGKAKGTGHGKATGATPGTATGRGPVGSGVPGTSGTPTRRGQGAGDGDKNSKITFCHVPPGNPANGHLITTSVNAITPGHTNHPGDIIPSFTFTKHGRTITFPGQNWDAAGQAAVAAGCTVADSAGATEGRSASGGSADLATPADGPRSSTGLGTGLPVSTPDASSSARAISTTSASSDVPTGTSIVDRVLPSTGGARLAVLVVGGALLAGGILVVTRARRRVVPS